jgi:midasin
VAQKYILRPVKSVQAFLSQCPSRPDHVDHFQQLGGFWLRCGPLPIESADYFILTPSVKAKISNLTRAIAYHHSPILIEGPTSSGKTSSVEYMARRTGHRFIRINNHEHTDIQEYLGSYQSDPQTGKLVFQDGLLVRALRRGDWIVLDELNLAPTEVLEALNRLLDDNRELLIPDTQEIVKPHPDFMCFATQNPHGLYGGRKVLSRAFRNRFLEFSFDDVPQDELETIVCERCAIAPSFAKRIVNVFRELQKRRQVTRVFESKHSFATLRDVFRWANRSACSVQALAEDGFMLLAERARREEDRLSVKEVIESSMNVRIDTASMYDLARLSAQHPLSGLDSDFFSKLGVVWTESTRRAFILLSRALENREPVLLVGNPGSGKTTLAEVFSKCKSQRLHTVNCHQNTEAGDIIGGYRPIRNRSARESQLKDEICALLGFSNSGSQDASRVFTLFNEQTSKLADKLPAAEIGEIRSRILGLNAVFEWQDGPLVHAMRNGEVFLLDELSLVDDSVLERLNSVLEPERRLILVENSSTSETVEINSTQGFQVIATMNPGGDFGKKELSPALRNRFTEIWVPCIEDNFDIGAILLSVWRRPEYRIYTQAILQFKDWISSRVMDRTALSLRDILVRFLSAS